MSIEEKLKENLPTINFEYYMGWHGEKGAQRLYRNNELGLQMEVYTPKKHGQWGKAKTFYFIDSEKNMKWTDPVAFTKECIKRGILKS